VAASYFSGGAFCAPSHGCTHKSSVLGRVSAYRFELDAPIEFSQSLAVSLGHGIRNEIACEYAAVAYWYQTEPHAPFEPMPSVRRIGASGAVLSVVQWFALFVSIAGLGVALWRAALAFGR
jgi:hypothetical protein